MEAHKWTSYALSKGSTARYFDLPATHVVPKQLKGCFFGGFLRRFRTLSAKQYLTSCSFFLKAPTFHLILSRVV